jgi:putative ABC transport system permease protein
MRDDLKAAVRSLRSNRGFTSAALIVLTLGIGATTAIFSVVDAVVLRGLPFDDQHRLVAVGQRSAVTATAGAITRDPARLMFVAPQNYVDWVAQQQVFESMAAVASGWLTLRLPGVEPESLVPQRVTADFFKVLRVSPALGRTFTVDNETTGADRVALLSDGLWRRRFGADPHIVGRVIPLELLEGSRGAEEAGYEVIGVMPPDFTYPVGAARPTDIWIPYVVPERDRLRDPTRMATYLQVVARLKRDVPLMQAQAQMDQIASALERAHPVWNKDSRIGVRPLVDHLVGAEIKSWLLMLLAAVVMVLLIACGNIASLLLARATVREPDLAVRAALGASWSRLTRQLVIESLVLSGVGAVFGIVLAWWGIDVLRAAMPEGVPRVTTIALDFRVLATAMGVSVATGLLCGVGPALQAARPDLLRAMRDTGRSGNSPVRQRLRNALVVGEVSLAVVLLVGAALFIGSFVALLRIDPGFETTNVLTAQISPRITSVSDPPDHTAALADVVARIAALPGVEGVALLQGQLPLTDGIRSTSFPLPDGKIASLSTKSVSPEYHAVLRIPLRRGRFFTASDRVGAQSVIILNETAVATYFPGEDPIGRTFNGATIVGVVGDAHQNGVERDVIPEMYSPLAQGRAAGAELLVRTAGDPYDSLRAVRAAVFAVLPDVPLRNVTTMEEMFSRRMAQRRLNMLLLGLFGLLGLAIAGVGVYGLMAFVVAQRTREIGVRMALGASRTRVVGMVVAHAFALVAVGVTLGSSIAWYVSEAARAFLFGMAPTDPRAFTAAAISLLAAASAATVVPAWRAASVDPVSALRAE